MRKNRNGERGTRKWKIHKGICCIILSFFHLGAYGQNNYRVSYDDDFLKNINFPTTNATWVTRTTRKDKLVFNDSMCFSYLIMNNQDLMKKKKVYGQTMIHHGFLYNHNSKHTYEMVAWPAGKKNRYLIRDTLKAGNWIFLPDTKKILDYTCQSAISIYGNDTTRVWYTSEIPFSFGPRGFVGFPGLVLEVIHSPYQHIIVTKIEKGDFPVSLSVDVPIISSAEAIERRIRKGETNQTGTHYKTIRQKKN